MSDVCIHISDQMVTMGEGLLWATSIARRFMCILLLNPPNNKEL